MTAKLAKVFISGNSSVTRGGGIGSNGTVIIGTEETTQVSVRKMWEDDHNAMQKRPAFIIVHLIANVDGKDYRIETQKLNEQNGWETVFSDLPTELNGVEAIYTVKEDTVNGYTTNITGDAADGYVVTNRYVPENTNNVPKTGDMSNWMLWVGVGLASLCGIVALSAAKRKREQ